MRSKGSNVKKSTIAHLRGTGELHLTADPVKLYRVAQALRDGEIKARDDIRRKERTRPATQSKKAQGLETQQHVLEFAKTMKAHEPGLSKSAAARRIADYSQLCGFEQAKKYIDGKWKRTAWAQLGSVDR